MKGVTVPLLIMTMTGHYFLRPSEIVLDAALQFVERHHFVHRPQRELGPADEIGRR